MRFGHNKNKEAEINLTPLIDVVFLLLVFFMVSTKFISDNSFNVDLPLAIEGDSASKQNLLVVSVSSEGLLMLNGKKLADSSKKGLGKALSEACVGSTKDCVISLNADGAVDYQRIVDIMDVARFSGIRKVELATRKITQD